MSEKLDQLWFPKLQAICSATEEVEWLQKNMKVLQDEKEQFFANEIENPLFTYRAPKQPEVVATMATELSQLIQKEEKDAIVMDLYVRKLDNQIVRNNLAASSAIGNDKQFYQDSQELYGKPQKKYFAYIAKRLVQLCKEQYSPLEMKTHQLYKLASKITTENIDISVDILPPLADPGKPVQSIAQAIEIFQGTLDRLEIDGWELIVEEHTNRARFSVSAHSRKVYIPNQAQLDKRARKITTTQLRALAEHEIGVHANRAHSGYQSKLQLLAIGLDSYIRGEEGLASYMQQQVEGGSEFYGFDRYLAASLAIGMDGEVRDFRGVFGLMVEYYQLIFEIEGKSKDTLHKAQAAAWEVCIRIFRGTTGQTPGCIYTKDIVYMEGNIEMWHLLSDKPDIFPTLFAGKYNPLIKRHVKSLQTLGIIQNW